MSNNPHLVDVCCQTLLSRGTGWVNRRKETVEWLSESFLRHRLSLDFQVEALPRVSVNGNEAALVPVTLLRKEPGRFTRFDFNDDGGHSLPLPTRTQNATLSAAVLVESARRTLGQTSLPPAVEIELELIAKGEKDWALASLDGLYLKPTGPLASDNFAHIRHKLVGNPDFKWLLRVLAYSSITYAYLQLDARPRRLLKLTFEERISDVTTLGQPRVRAFLGAMGYGFGWRGYLGEIVSPFVGACSYHFELHAPEGMQLLEAGLAGKEPVTDNRRRAHLYVEDARSSRTEVAYAQFRIRGPGFVGSAALTSFVIAASMVVATLSVELLADAPTSAPSLLLLFPALVASYVARPSHPLVTRLLQWARRALLVAAGVAYVAAARLAVVSAAHPADQDNLEKFFTWMAVASGVLCLMLVATWRLPIRLNSPVRRWPRRLYRRLIRKTEEPDHPSPLAD